MAVLTAQRPEEYMEGQRLRTVGQRQSASSVRRREWRELGNGRPVTRVGHRRSRCIDRLSELFDASR